MAKELPYFKFEPNQWENGNIQICTREDKGLFIDLCSMYWSRLGDVPFKLAVQKLCNGNASAFDSLIQEFIFEIIDDSVCIHFLNEQLNEFENTSNQNRENALKRWAKQKNNASASKPHCESDTIRGEKRREENIYKEKNNLAYESESEFMEDWNASRRSILGVQSNMRKLAFHELENFKQLNKNFLKEDFKNGMRGLMSQKNGILPTMQLRPDHFLKDLNIEKYIDAHLNKKQLYTDNKKIDRL